MPTNDLIEGVAIVSDEELVERIRSGDLPCLEVLMRRYNQRLYRVARGILRNDADAEEAVQDAYVRAYRQLDQFDGRGRFSSWLAQIVAREALQRLRKQAGLAGRTRVLELESDLAGSACEPVARTPGPAETAAGQELHMLIQSAIDELPARLRSVFVLRAVEQMPTAQVAECLGIPVETVKTRLFRAKSRLRRRLNQSLRSSLSASYTFGQERCDRMVASVFRIIGKSEGV